MTDDIIIPKSALEGFTKRINDKSKPPIPVTMPDKPLKTLDIETLIDRFKEIGEEINSRANTTGISITYNIKATQYINGRFLH